MTTIPVYLCTLPCSNHSFPTAADVADRPPAPALPPIFLPCVLAYFLPTLSTSRLVDWTTYGGGPASVIWADSCFWQTRADSKVDDSPDMPQFGATFYPGGVDDYLMPEVLAPSPQRCVVFYFIFYFYFSICLFCYLFGLTSFYYYYSPSLTVHEKKRRLSICLSTC